MTTGERWLAATWQLVHADLPSAPARVVEVGCGRLGGFVPMLRSSGYQAVGIDPHAPDEPHYQRVEFERAVIRNPVDAAVASISLHHVGDPAKVIDRIVSMLEKGGAVVVVEWAWEKFDERTADWCFERLRGDQEGWLHRRRDEWLASDRDWANYLGDWAERERLHRGEVLARLLDERLERRLLMHGPYFFADLSETTEADEQAAIDSGQIHACRIHYVGTRR